MKLEEHADSLGGGDDLLDNVRPDLLRGPRGSRSPENRPQTVVVAY